MKLGSLGVLSSVGMVFLNVSFAATLIYKKAKPSNDTSKKGASNWEAPLARKINIGKCRREDGAETIRIKSTTKTTNGALSEHNSFENDKAQYPDDDWGSDTNNENTVGKTVRYEVSTEESKNFEEKRDASENNVSIQANDTPSTATAKPTASPRLESGNQNQTTLSADDPHSSFNGFAGDLVGWRKVDIREFPYVVSIMHPKYKVHICTGTLLTSKIVLSYIQCVVRRTSVAEKIIFTIAEPNQFIVAAGHGGVNSEEQATSIYRDVRIIYTAYNNAFNGKLVFFRLDKAVPYSIHHHPVKMYSTDLGIVGRKLQEFVGKSFCEVLAWDDTVICSDGNVQKPKHLKAYRVKILDSDVCMKQHFRLGLQFSITAEWSVEGSATERNCFAGMGGRRCGSAPGGPVVCGNSVYGIMTLGTACSEFGDYTFFIPLNTTEIHSLFEKTIKTDRKKQISQGRKNRGLWLLIIPMLWVCP